MKTKLLKLFLLIYWLVFTSVFVLFSDISFSTVSKNHSGRVFAELPKAGLAAGQKITGQLRAEYDNLGIVLIRFNTFHRQNHDFLIFRIKQKGLGEWYYQNRYDALQLIDGEYYPFGFTPIGNSRGKIYQFEIESVQGTPANSVTVSAIQPPVITKYQMPKKNISALILAKTRAAIENNNLLPVSLIFLSPFLLSILGGGAAAYFLLTLLFIFDLFLIGNIYDLVIITMTIDIIFLSRKFFIIALVFLLLSMILNGEKTAVYAFVFLAIGTLYETVNYYRRHSG